MVLKFPLRIYKIRGEKGPHLHIPVSASRGDDVPPSVGGGGGGRGLEMTNGLEGTIE